MTRDELENTIREPITELGDETRAALRGSAYPKLADMLTVKVCDAIRGMPGASPESIRNAEVLIAVQLLNGTRSETPS